MLFSEVDGESPLMMRLSFWDKDTCGCDMLLGRKVLYQCGRVKFGKYQGTADEVRNEGSPSSF